MRRHHALTISAAWEDKETKEQEGDGVFYYDNQDEAGMGIYDSGRPILFREFVEGLVRVAFQKFCVVNQTVTLKAALKAVVEDHLRVYATQTGLNALEEKIAEPKVRACLEANAPLFDAIFKRYSEKDDSGMFISKREWLILVQDSISFGKRKALRTPEILALCAPSSPEGHHRNHHHHQHHHAKHHGDLNEKAALASLMVKEEFLEALCRLANDYSTDMVPLQEKIKSYVKAVLAPLMANFVPPEGATVIKVTGLAGQKVVENSKKKSLQRPPRRIAF